MLFKHIRSGSELQIPQFLSDGYLLLKQGSAVRVSWEDWGPKITRVIRVDHRTSVAMSVYGSMALVPDEDYYMLYDFNQKTIRRDLARSTGDNLRTENIFTEPTAIDSSNLLESRVTTNLPCRITKVAALKGIDQSRRVAHLCGDTVVFLPNSVSLKRRSTFCVPHRLQMHYYFDMISF